MTVKKNTVYAFIDSQNLNLGTSKDLYKNNQLIYRGWKLDFNKFYKYLSNKFHVSKAILFIGYIKQYEPLYRELKSYGYSIVFKPTITDEHGKQKGNIDAELVLHSAKIEYDSFDQAVIVSGDGDFYCLHKFLESNGKLLGIVIPNRKSESSLLNKFQQFKFFLIRDKDKVEI